MTIFTMYFENSIKPIAEKIRSICEEYYKKYGVKVTTVTVHRDVDISKIDIPGLKIVNDQYCLKNHFWLA